MEWYRLKMAGIKDSVIIKLMKEFDSYQEIFMISRDKFKQYFKFADEVINSIYDSRNRDFSKEKEKLKNLGIKVISIVDDEYPVFLKNISSPPLFLHYRGDISLADSEKIIGVVGTRRATVYGRNACEKIVDDLVDGDVVTVSGLASGIDTVCHKRTLQKGGKTIAVVGSGLDVIYPAENRKYWQEIGEKGLIISEFPLGTPPNNFNFPMRNRIIAGLSKGVAVIESKEKGGSLITAYLALEEGRDVFAVPGDIFSPVSAGTNELIKKSEAKLITSGKDILEEFGWNISQKSEADFLDISMNEMERKVYEILSTEKNLDEIIAESGIKAGNLLALLMEMEIKGIVSSVSGGKYRRKK